jgi:hypothetical protein
MLPHHCGTFAERLDCLTNVTPMDKEDDTVVVDAVVFENVDESSHDASLVATTSELAATNHQSTPTTNVLLKPQMYLEVKPKN